MNADQVRVLLQQAVDEAPSQEALALKYRATSSSIRATLAGKIDPPPSVLMILGLRKVVTYEPIPRRSKTRFSFGGG